MTERKMGREFLLSLQFMHGEALRRDMVMLADVIAHTFDAASRLLKAQAEVAIDPKFAEYNFLRRFRRLNPETRQRVLEFLERHEHSSGIPTHEYDSMQGAE